ncbi:hypothetical protein I546_6509 [Mycobacterium kansasii 732]|nr:hypothetical protein I546_6509 [Mycobacterium kansasii 732]
MAPMPGIDGDGIIEVTGGGASVAVLAMLAESLAAGSGEHAADTKQLVAMRATIRTGMPPKTSCFR